MLDKITFCIKYLLMLLFEPVVPFEVTLKFVRVDVEEIDEVELVAKENVDDSIEIGKGKSNKFDSKSLKSSCEDIFLEIKKIKRFILNK